MPSLRFNSSRHTRSRLLVYGLIAFVLGYFLLIKVPGFPLFWRCDPDPPANWDKLYKWEDELPQHDVDLPFPEGKTGRYVYFNNQIQQLGWNNQLNEV